MLGFIVICSSADLSGSFAVCHVIEPRGSFTAFTWSLYHFGQAHFASMLHLGVLLRITLCSLASAPQGPDLEMRHFIHFKSRAECLPVSPKETGEGWCLV